MRKLTFNEWLAVAIAVIIVSYFFFFNGTIFSLNVGANSVTTSGIFQAEGEATSSASTTAFMTQTLPGIQITDTVVGTGEEAVAGKVVVVHYTGKFANGQVFDSSVSRGTPFDFPLGAGRVIQGWDEGVAGMKVGGKRTLVIAPEKGYGAQDVTNPYTGEVVIPANSTLVFDVELLDVQ